MVESIKELRKICQDPKIKDDFLYSKYFMRKFSIYLTRLFLIAGISANQTTLISAIFLILSFLPFLLGFHWHHLLISALLLNIAYFLDHVDGELARYYGSTYYGRLLDVITHDIMYFVFIFVGSGLSFRNNDLTFLVFGFSASLFKILHRLHEMRFEYLNVKINLGAGVLKHKKFAGVAYDIGMAHIFLPLLYITAVLNLADIFIYFYGTYMPLYWVLWLLRKKGWGGKDQHLDAEKELWDRFRDNA